MFRPQRDRLRVASLRNRCVKQLREVGAAVLEEPQEKLHVLRWFAVMHIQLVLRQRLLVAPDVEIVTAHEDQFRRGIGESDREKTGGLVTDASEAFNVFLRKTPMKRLPQISRKRPRGGLVRDKRVGIRVRTRRRQADAEEYSRDSGTN